MPVGLNEALQEDYLHSASPPPHFSKSYRRGGLPIVQPPGGHAIYIDARAFCSYFAGEFPVWRWRTNFIWKAASARSKSAR